MHENEENANKSKGLICQFCSKSFSLLSNMKRHEREIHFPSDTFLFLIILYINLNSKEPLSLDSLLWPDPLWGAPRAQGYLGRKLDTNSSPCIMMSL